MFKFTEQLDQDEKSLIAGILMSIFLVILGVGAGIFYMNGWVEGLIIHMTFIFIAIIYNTWILFTLFE